MTMKIGSEKVKETVSKEVVQQAVHHETQRPTTKKPTMQTCKLLIVTEETVQTVVRIPPKLQVHSAEQRSHVEDDAVLCQATATMKRTKPTNFETSGSESRPFTRQPTKQRESGATKASSLSREASDIAEELETKTKKKGRSSVHNSQLLHLFSFLFLSTSQPLT